MTLLADAVDGVLDRVSVTALSASPAATSPARLPHPGARAAAPPPPGLPRPATSPHSPPPGLAALAASIPASATAATAGPPARASLPALAQRSSAPPSPGLPPPPPVTPATAAPRRHVESLVCQLQGLPVHCGLESDSQLSRGRRFLSSLRAQEVQDRLD